MTTDDATYIEYGSEMIIIREIFDGAHELFENELERAFDIGCPTIVIEPCRLGEETARWIYVGDCLSRSSVITGLGSIAAGLVDHRTAQYSLLAASLLANSIHLLSWQSDICSYYRVERNPDRFGPIMASSKRQFNDNLSLHTSVSYSPSLTPPEQAEQAIIGGYDSCSGERKRAPVILSRKTSSELRRSKFLTAAVSLLAIAFSFFRFFRSSLVKFTIF